MSPNGTIMGALYKGLWISAVIAIVAFFPITTWMLGDLAVVNTALDPGRGHACLPSGSAPSSASPSRRRMVYITDYYTVVREQPGPQSIARGFQRVRPRHERHPGPRRGHGGHRLCRSW